MLTLTNLFLIHCNKFGLRSGSSCHNAVSDPRKISFCKVSDGSKFNCAIADTTKAFYHINHNVFMNGLRDASLPMHVIDTLGYMLGNNFANVVLAALRESPGELGWYRKESVWTPLLFASTSIKL